MNYDYHGIFFLLDVGFLDPIVERMQLIYSNVVALKDPL
jgi:hypothetical protein